MTVLKIIGIILLILLGILLLLAAILLFVPLRYDVQVTREENKTQGEEPLLQVCVTWLMRLFGLSIWMDISLRWGVKIRAAKWILLHRGEAESVEKEEDAISAPVSAGREVFIEEAKQSSPLPTETTSADNAPAYDAVKENEGEQSEKINEPEMEESLKDEPGTASFTENVPGKIRLGERLSVMQDILSALPGKLIDLVTGLLFALQDGEDALDDWVSAQQKKLNKFSPFLTTESKNWYNKVLKNLRQCIRHYQPRRWQGYIHGGTGSADTTAIAAGVLYRIIPEAGGEVEIIPDFDAMTIETRLRIRGRIRACHLVWFVIKVLVDRDSWRMLRKVRPRKKKGE